MATIGHRLHEEFLKPGQMWVDTWELEDLSVNANNWLDSWLKYENTRHKIVAWLGYRCKPQVVKEGCVFFNEGQYGHWVQVRLCFVVDEENTDWQVFNECNAWEKLGEWDNF